MRNQIAVLPVSQFDDELRYRIARSIYGNSNFWNYAIMANPPIHIVVEHGRVTLTGVVQSEVDRMLARSLATQFGALVGDERAEDRRGSRESSLKNPSELDDPAGGGRRDTALVYRSRAHAALGASLILGHGAGAGQRSAFMVDFARALAALGVDIVTFNFPTREQGRRIPDRAPVLEACYRAVIAAAHAELASADARCSSAANRWADGSRRRWRPRIRTLPIAGLVLLGYPLHPPGRPTERRDTHLPAVGRPMLFVQGSRDAFGTPAELAPIIGTLAAAGDAARRRRGRSLVQAAAKDPAAQAAVSRRRSARLSSSGCG